MPLRGQEKVLANFDRERQRLITSVEKNAREMAEFLLKKIRENASLTDHTLDDLRQLGHPYAKRNPRPPHTPWWLIHRQSGTLVDALEMDNPAPGHYRVGFDENRAPHVPYVLLGTRTMIGRDILNETVRAEAENLRKIFAKDIRAFRRVS